MADESRGSAAGSTDSVPDNSNDNSIDTADPKKRKEMEFRSTAWEQFEKIFENGLNLFFYNNLRFLPFESTGKASMSSHQPNSVEDIFDSSMNLEDTHYKEGYSEGYSNGLASGIYEGREVGLKTGFEVGEELGFYRACLDVWNAALVVQPNYFSSRVQKNIKQMDELLQKYPISEPEDESTTDTVNSLRLKFRAICATLNVKLEYNGYPRTSDVKNSGF